MQAKPLIDSACLRFEQERAAKGWSRRIKHLELDNGIPITAMAKSCFTASGLPVLDINRMRKIVADKALRGGQLILASPDCLHIDTLPGSRIRYEIDRARALHLLTQRAQQNDVEVILPWRQVGAGGCAWRELSRRVCIDLTPIASNHPSALNLFQQKNIAAALKAEAMSGGAGLLPANADEWLSHLLVFFGLSPQILANKEDATLIYKKSAVQQSVNVKSASSLEFLFAKPYEITVAEQSLIIAGKKNELFIANLHPQHPRYLVIQKSGKEASQMYLLETSERHWSFDHQAATIHLEPKQHLTFHL